MLMMTFDDGVDDDVNLNTLNVKDNLTHFCCTNVTVTGIITTILCNLHNML